MKPILLLFAGWMLSFGISAQTGTFRRFITPVDDRPVIRGDRPPFDFSRVPAAKIRPGVIHVKIQGNLSGYLDTATFRADAGGVMLFGIPDLDRLNKKYKVMGIRQTFFASLKEKQFDRRHRKWDLHLWYDLFVPEDVDTKIMVGDYAGLSQVSHAEPVLIMRIEETHYRYVRPGKSFPASRVPGSFYPDDPKFGDQWHLNNTGQAGGTPGCDMHLPAAWSICKGDSDVIVAVMDGGIEYLHDDLKANIWPGNGFNFIDYSYYITPTDHGTHIAGTIAGNTNNGIGISGIAGGDGTGNGVKLMSCQVSDQTGIIYPGVVDSYVWAADHGAAISNNSWGSGSDIFGLPLMDAIDYFNVNGGGSVMEGGLVICAAGNGYNENMFYPASYPNCMGIAATDNKDIRSDYSNYHDWVDLSAPGGEYPPEATEILSTLTGNGYGFDEGTSMSAGDVSGVAALVISYVKGQLTAGDLRQILLNSADNIDSLNPLYAGKLGSGRVNAYKALLLAQSYIQPNLIPPPVALTATATGDSLINLDWQPNADNDSVLLAYNLTSRFGKPAGNYLPGQAIDSGGIILFSGKLTGFSHTHLVPNTVYYYSLWSKKNNQYSFINRRAQDTTDCGPIRILPYLQDFELQPSLPRCWSQDNPVYHWNFEYGGGSNHPPAPFSGQLNAVYELSDFSGITNKLITEVFDLGNYTNVRLSYWHAQPVWVGRQDELRVYYRNSPSSGWNLLKTYTQNIPDWTKDSIDLPGLSSSYQIAFEGKAYDGYGVTLDHIELRDITPASLSITPDNRNVSPAEGNTAFMITSNRPWTVTTDTVWCIPDASGFGNDSLHVHYLFNHTWYTRTAHLTINVNGLPPATVTVTQIGIGGIGEIMMDDGISVWPNPLRDETLLNIRGTSLQDPEITLTGIDGRRILHKKLKGLNEFRLEIPSLPPGCYFVMIKTDRQACTKQLVKIR